MGGFFSITSWNDVDVDTDTDFPLITEYSLASQMQCDQKKIAKCL